MDSEHEGSKSASFLSPYLWELLCDEANWGPSSCNDLIGKQYTINIERLKQLLPGILITLCKFRIFLFVCNLWVPLFRCHYWCGALWHIDIYIYVTLSWGFTVCIYRWLSATLQDCSISSALAIEILQFCTKPSIFICIFLFLHTCTLQTQILIMLHIILSGEESTPEYFCHGVKVLRPTLLWLHETLSTWDLSQVQQHYGTLLAWTGQAQVPCEFPPINSQETPHSSPVRARYGVSVVNLKSDSCSANASKMLCVISW